MKTKSIRLPDDILTGVKLVEKREHLDEATAIRKILRVGLQTYVIEMYKTGHITLREAASRLGLSQIDTVDLLLEAGVTGNLEGSDVLKCIDRLGAAF